MTTPHRTRASTGALPAKKQHLDEMGEKEEEEKNLAMLSNDADGEEPVHFVRDGESPPPQLDEVEGPVESGFAETEEDFVVGETEEVITEEGGLMVGAGVVEGHHPDEEDDEDDDDGVYDSPDAPIYDKKSLSFNEVEKILLGEERVPKNRICAKMPIGEREKKKSSGTYVVDLASIGDFKNVLNDNLAPWYAGYGANATSGSLTRHYILNGEGKATRVDKQHRLPTGQKSDLRIARTFYTNKAAKAVGGRLVRMIYRCLARNGQLRRFVVVTYEWKTPIIEFESLGPAGSSGQQVVYPIDRSDDTLDSNVPALLGGEGNDDIFLSHDDLINSRVEVEGDEESDADDGEDEIIDPESPMYGRKSIGFDEVEKILLGAERVPKNLICHKTPTGERERRKRQASYIVDLASLENPNDILNDNLGSWQSGTGGERASYPGSGSRMRYYLLKPDGGALRVDKHGRKPPDEIQFDLKINRCLYTNRSAREQGGRLIRRIFRCYTRNGETRRFAVVTYEWVGKIVPFDLLPPVKRGRKPGISPRRKGDPPRVPEALRATAVKTREDSMSMQDMEGESGVIDDTWGMEVVHDDDIEVGASTTISPSPGNLHGAAMKRIGGPLTNVRPIKKRVFAGEEEKVEKEMKVLSLQEKYYQYLLYKTTLEIRQLNPDFEPETFEESLNADPRAAVNQARVVQTPATSVYVVDPNEGSSRQTVGNSQQQFIIRSNSGVGNVVQYGYSGM